MTKKIEQLDLPTISAKKKNYLTYLTFINKIIAVFIFIIASAVCYAGVHNTILASKFEPIKQSAREYLRNNAAGNCQEAKMVPVVINEQWASIRVIPDMKTCITDPCWVVMKKSGNTWQGFTLGTCCFIDVPEELFQGEAEGWPEPIEEDKQKYREQQRFKDSN